MDTNDTNRQSAAGRRRGLAVALALAGVAAAAAGIAWASGALPEALGHGHMGAAMARDHVEFRIHRALKKVSATQAQEDQILAIVDGLFAEHAQMAPQRQALHQRALAALTGTTVDRAALEAVRVEAMQRLDQGSEDLVKALGDIAEVLTPAQRQQLAALHKQQFE
ncbi:MAG TPA: Spy/CpxP family protein refolding chaperone [Thermoanaerobaculaceae bacterium]|nr:Spy/CpxP family protein refolding chaperone [Thermoanaerobaculaceae bacterium]